MIRNSCGPLNINTSVKVLYSGVGAVKVLYSGVGATLMMFGFLVSHYMERRRVDILTCVQTHITTLTLTITH